MQRTYKVKKKKEALTQHYETKTLHGCLTSFCVDTGHAVHGTCP